MLDKWYVKELHMERDKVPAGWFLANIESCSRDVAVKFCPHWHKKGQENALSREDVINSSLTDEELRVNAPTVANLAKTLDRAKFSVLSSLPKRRNKKLR